MQKLKNNFQLKSFTDKVESKMCVGVGFVCALIQTASFDSRGGLYIVRARDTALFTTELVARTHKGAPRFRGRGIFNAYFYINAVLTLY